MLARLEAFLPELKKANETLDASQASIENGEEDDEDEDQEGENGGPKIEMVSGVNALWEKHRETKEKKRN